MGQKRGDRLPGGQWGPSPPLTCQTRRGGITFTLQPCWVRQGHSTLPLQVAFQQEARKSQRTRWSVLLLTRGAVLQGGTLAGHYEINRPGQEGNTHSLPSRGREEGSQGNFGWYTAGRGRARGGGSPQGPSSPPTGGCTRPGKTRFCPGRRGLQPCP